VPFSSAEFDLLIVSFLRVVQPKTFLDIGAGAGKYGDMIQAIDPDVDSVAVELEEDYIEKFGLISKYKKVLAFSAINLITPTYFEMTFDVVILGDVIEHMRKSEGIDLLNFLIYRSRWIVVVFPHGYIQNAVDGYHAEAHISAWSESDFQGFERTKLYSKGGQRLVIIRGYIEQQLDVSDVELVIEAHG